MEFLELKYCSLPCSIKYTKNVRKTIMDTKVLLSKRNKRRLG